MGATKRLALTVNRPGILLAVALVVSACGGRAQVPPTQVIVMPTSAPTAAPPTATAPPAAPTDTLAATETPLPDGVGGGGEPLTYPVVLLADYGNSPPTVSGVDPATGESNFVLAAPNLRAVYRHWATAAAFFYLDGKTQGLRRIGYDGSIGELPFVNSGGAFFEGDYLPSPDGLRVAWGTSLFDATGTQGDTHIQLKVANIDGAGETLWLDQWLKDESLLPLPMAWSPDGRYLYFSNMLYGIGGYILFSGAPDLQRLDLTTGEVVEVLADRGCLCPMAFSPDGGTLAVIEGIEPLSLVLVTMETGVRRQLNLPGGYLQAGDIVWSPDGGALALTMARSNPDNEAYTTVHLDVQSLDLTTLIPDDLRLLTTAAWLDPDVIWLNDVGGAAWTYNLSTATLDQWPGIGQVVRLVR